MGTKKVSLQDLLNHLVKINPDNDDEIINYVQEYIKKFDRLADSNHNIFYFFSFTILAVSALTPLFNSLIPPDATFSVFNLNTVKFYTSILAVISAVSAGSLQIIQAFDKMNLEKVTRIHLEREILLYKANGGIYSPENNRMLVQESTLPAQRRSLFAQRIGEIIVNKFDQYYSLTPGGTQRQGHDRDNLGSSGSGQVQDRGNIGSPIK